MPWMVISLINPEPALCGALARFLVEIPVHTYAGKIDRAHADTLIGKVRCTKGKAAIIQARNNELGLDVELVNHDNYSVVDFDGLIMISRKVRRIAKSVVSDGAENSS